MRIPSLELLLQLCTAQVVGGWRQCVCVCGGGEWGKVGWRRGFYLKVLAVKTVSEMELASVCVSEGSIL